MKTNTEQQGSSSACGHWPPMLAVITVARCYKVRCLTCGQTGPERESTSLAWAALLSARREPGAGEVGATGTSRSRAQG